MAFNISVKNNVQANKYAKYVVNDEVGTMASKAWRDLIDPFVPYRTGTLSGNVSLDTPWEIHYKEPYSPYVYNGDYMNFRTDNHPLASAEWDYAAMQAGQDDKLSRTIEDFINQRGFNI